eukprot:gene10280-11337_t
MFTTRPTGIVFIPRSCTFLARSSSCRTLNSFNDGNHNGLAEERNKFSRNVTTMAAETSKAKPFSDIPLHGGHWLRSIFNIFFRFGGVHTSFFKIHENMLRKYGSISRHNGPLGCEVFLGDPAGVRTVFSMEPKYPHRFKAVLFDAFYAREIKDPGVFFLNGEKWHKHKMLLAKKMLRPPQINSYIPRIDAIAADAIQLIKRERNMHNHARPYEVDDISMELFKWSFETVTDFIFDQRFHSLSENPPPQSIDFIKAIGEFLDNALQASLFPLRMYDFIKTRPYKLFNKNFLKMYNFTEMLIEEKLQDFFQKENHLNSKESSHGLIPFLLSSKDFAADEIVSSVVDTLFAGVDTTSNTMQWMLYLLAKNPDVQEELKDEIARKVPVGTPLEEDILHSMPLTRCTIKETLRLYPVLFVTSRLLSADAVICGYEVPAGTQINIMNHAMARREDLFEKADSFIPHRWLRDDNGLNLDPYGSLPFGFGVRMCLGRRLAELEMQILLVKILQNFHLKISPDHVVTKYLRGTTIPNKPIRVQFHNV